jgi:hypothetical protein
LFSFVGLRDAFSVLRGAVAEASGSTGYIFPVELLFIALHARR